LGLPAATIVAFRTIHPDEEIVEDYHEFRQSGLARIAALPPRQRRG
jgi:hypothetical protein